MNLLLMIGKLTIIKNFPRKNTSLKLTMIPKKEYLQVGLIGLKNQFMMVEPFGNMYFNFRKIFKQLKKVFAQQDINQEQLNK